MRVGLAAAVGALVVAGCAQKSRPPLPAGCTEGRGAIVRALRGAPRRVAFPDGTRLSDCVSRADDDGDLQQFGVLVTQVGDDLSERARADPREALRLGYLVGAARRGAAHTNGVQAELVHRLEAVGRRVDGPDFERGLRAGTAAG